MATTSLCSRCNSTLVVQNPPSHATRLEQLRSIRGAPSSTEANGILQSLENCQNDLSSYDTEIARVEAVLSELKRKRSCLLGYMGERRSLLAPVRKLPIEILTLIFSFAIEDFGLQIYRQGGDVEIVATTLCFAQVCTFWRKAAMSCSSLWSGLELDLAHPVGLKQDRIRELIYLYIVNSGNCGLDLNLEACEVAHGMLAYAELGSCSRTIIQLLLIERARWRCVNIDLLDDIYILDYLLGLTGSYDRLEAVELGRAISYVPPEDQTETLLDGLAGNAPNFSTLILSGRNAATLLSDVPFNIGQIKSLTLDSGYYNVWQHLYDILVRFTSLENLAIAIDHNPKKAHDHSIPQCPSNSLQSLTMSIESLMVASEVTTALFLPSLTELDLCFDSCWESDTERLPWMQSFKTMLQQSSCRLQSFELSFSELFTTEELLELLSWTPTITDLSLDADCQTLTDRFFRDLTSQNSASVPVSDTSRPLLLPCLKTLVIRLTDLYSRQIPELPDPELIVSMILSRRTSIASPVLFQDTGDSKSALPVTNELVHFAIHAPARTCSASERSWAQQLRTMAESRLLQHRTSPRERLTCILDLGEL